MEKILFIAYRNIYPVKSGEKIRMMQNLQFLSKNFYVDCAMVCEEDPTSEDIDYLKRYAHEVFLFKKSHFLGELWHCFLNLLRQKPLQNGYFYNHKLSRFVKNKSSCYDGFFCNHMRTASYVMKLTKKRRVLDCPDCITLNTRNEMLTSKGIRKILFRLEYRFVKNYEAQFYQKFNSVFVISENDYKGLLEINPALKSTLHILYNATRDLGFDQSVQESATPSICFLGRLAYGPNINAITFFALKIFPPLKEAFPNLVFNIYGGSHSSEVEKLSTIPGIKIHGYIQNVAKEIQQNTFVVAPMISGSGTQNKILECMNLRKVVVTTKIGVDGLENISGNEIVVAENEQDLIKKCLYFLSPDSRIERERIGSLAQKYVQQVYSNDVVERQFINGLDSFSKS